MIAMTRMGLMPTALVAAALVLAGCSPTGSGRGATTSAPAPAPITPVQTGTVQSADLPPIDGQQQVGQTQTSQVMTGTGIFDPGQPGSASVAGTTSVVPAIGDVPGSSNANGGRDLSAGLSMETMIGGWTVTAGAEQCRLNLTYTAKGATGRYRASTPTCTQQVLASVTSWQLLGNQIQLYNDDDEMVGSMLRSGDRFVGTLAGGQSVSMV